jgi:NADPH-dependent ferric siderophore reductase
MQGGYVAERPSESQAHCMKVEQLTDTLRRLVAERERLHDRSASWAELERNRLEIVFHQQKLSHALIEIHLPEPLPEAA